MQRNIRMLRLKARQPGHQPLGCKLRGHRHGHGLPYRMADTVHTGSDFLQATTDPRLQLLAFGRQRDGAHLPVDSRRLHPRDPA